MKTQFSFTRSLLPSFLLLLFLLLVFTVALLSASAAAKREGEKDEDETIKVNSKFDLVGSSSGIVSSAVDKISSTSSHVFLGSLPSSTGKKEESETKLYRLKKKPRESFENNTSVVLFSSSTSNPVGIFSIALAPTKLRRGFILARADSSSPTKTATMSKVAMIDLDSMKRIPQQKDIDLGLNGYFGVDTAFVTHDETSLIASTTIEGSEGGISQGCQLLKFSIGKNQMTISQRLNLTTNGACVAATCSNSNNSSSTLFGYFVPYCFSSQLGNECLLYKVSIVEKEDMRIVASLKLSHVNFGSASIQYVSSSSSHTHDDDALYLVLYTTVLKIVFSPSPSSWNPKIIVSPNCSSQASSFFPISFSNPMIVAPSSSASPSSKKGVVDGIYLAASRTAPKVAHNLSIVRFRADDLTIDTNFLHVAPAKAKPLGTAFSISSSGDDNNEVFFSTQQQLLEISNPVIPPLPTTATRVPSTTTTASPSSHHAGTTFTSASSAVTTTTAMTTTSPATTNSPGSHHHHHSNSPHNNSSGSGNGITKKQQAVVIALAVGFGVALSVAVFLILRNAGYCRRRIGSGSGPSMSEIVLHDDEDHAPANQYVAVGSAADEVTGENEGDSVSSGRWRVSGQNEGRYGSVN